MLEPPISADAWLRIEWTIFVYVGIPCLVVMAGLAAWQTWKESKKR